VGSSRTTGIEELWELHVFACLIDYLLFYVPIKNFSFTRIPTGCLWLNQNLKKTCDIYVRTPLTKSSFQTTLYDNDFQKKKKKTKKTIEVHMRGKIFCVIYRIPKLGLSSLLSTSNTKTPTGLSQDLFPTKILSNLKSHCFQLR
jgi:hypothetical protein